MKKQSNDQTILSDQALQEIEEAREGLPKFEEEKVVDENTPYIFMSQAVQKQLLKEGNKVGGGSFGYIVNLFENDKKEFQLLLEKAGYTVKALPASIN